MDLDFSSGQQLTSCLLQQGCLEQSYWTEGPCSRARHQLVDSIACLAMPTKAPFWYVSAYTRARFGSH